MLRTFTAICLAASASLVHAQEAPPAGPPLTPNSGPVGGRGTLTDSDGIEIGEWSVDATLRAGNFTGNAAFSVKGVQLALPLMPARSYLENGKCYFYAEQGRTRMEFGGPCTRNGVSGRLNGFVPQNEIFGVVGFMRGRFASGSAPAATDARAAPSGAQLPTGKLTCAWMERIGGNVAGDLARYELRFSNMVTLTLSPGGTYRTANTSGRFVRNGDAIRLVGGQFDGALGRLQPDRSGTPAVYFERDDNRRPSGVHIVDPARTSCTVARGG